MIEDSTVTPRKRPIKRVIAIVVASIVLIGAVFLYNNFNRLISDALLKSFDSSIASEVYELKFEKLLANPFEGTIRVYQVTMQPREKPIHEYSYINSSFRLQTEKLILENVEIFTLLRFKKLKLDKIVITKPDVELSLSGKRHIILPFKDSTSTDTTNTNKKKVFNSFLLNEFQLIEAAFHVTNEDKQREFNIYNFSITLRDLLITQQPGEYSASLDRVVVTLGKLTGNLQKGPFQSVSFKGFNIGVDSLEMHLTLDTLTYGFHDFSIGLRDLDVQTADSLFHLTTQSFAVSYRNKLIRLKGIDFTPNVSHAVLQKDHEFMHTEFSGRVKILELKQVNFDSLIYARKLFIDSIFLDSVKASIFKDKTKPLNKNRFPAYLGQTVSKISMPLRIGYVKATHLDLDNTEQKTDTTVANVIITKATLEVKNITNRSRASVLTMKADAWLENRAHFNTKLEFHYSKPQFEFEGSLKEFNLADLSPLIRAYTPAKITKGIADEISFSGTAEQTKAMGTMKFLYHDLEVDLELQDKKWASSIIAFAANTVLDSSNPPSSDKPPKQVKFQIKRDMNKGFVNVVIKSLLNGLKETMVMSKENRKKYRKDVKESAQRNKKK